MTVGELDHTSGFHVIQQGDGLFCGHAHLFLQHGLRDAVVLPSNLGGLRQLVRGGLFLFVILDFFYSFANDTFLFQTVLFRGASCCPPDSGMSGIL